MTTTTTTTDTGAWDFTSSTADDVTVLYRDADVTTKAAMRRDITDAITSAVIAGDVSAAQHAVAMRDAMSAAPKSSVTVDYAARIADHAATLSAALAAVMAGDYTLPDGVSVDVSTVDFDGGVAGDVSRYVSVSGRKSGRGNVSRFISDALSRCDGPATIAQLRAAWTATDDYPTAPPSSGAIGACLNRDRDDDDDFDAVTVDGHAGATLV